MSLGIKASQFGLDAIQFTNPFDAVLGNGCCCAARDLHQLAPRVRPAIGELNVPSYAVGSDQPIVSGIAIHLQNALKPLQYPFRMNAPATRRIGEGYARWRATAPWAIIPRQRPEVSSLRLARTRVKNRSTRLVHEQFGRTLQVGNQCVEDGAQFIGSSTDPVCKRGAVEIDALAADDLGLSIKRKVIRIFGDQHMGHRRFCRQSRLDQPWWSRSLDNAVGAGTACIFGATGADSDEAAPLFRDDCAPGFRDDLAPLRLGSCWSRLFSVYRGWESRF